MIIRNETKTDRRAVEELTRRAFYNLYVSGCVEHYLAHVMREHEDFIPELDFVAELDGKIIGNIMYTKARLVDEDGAEKEILTFWAGLHRTGIPAEGIREAADGAFL